MDGSMVFARWRHCTPHLTHAFWAHPSPNPKTVFEQLVAERAYTLQWTALFPLLSLSMGVLDPIRYMILWTHPSPQPKLISIDSAVFAQLLADRLVNLKLLKF